jgi:MFS family permease
LPALLLGFFLMQTGNTFQGTILSIRGEIEGFALAQIGAVGAGLWAGVIVGSLGAAKVIRRVGHIRTFAAFGAIASTAPLAHLLVVDPLVWIVARALTGFCFAAMFIVVESWLNAGASSENKGTDPQHLRHDGIAGRHRRPASSARDRSSGLQAVLHHRLHHFDGGGADRFDGRSGLRLRAKAAI